MSHISKIENVEIKSISALKKASQRLGCEFKENQKEFVYYMGRKGKCNHAIKVPNCSYEIGVVDKGNKTFGLECDLYSQGGLVKALGTNLNKLNQMYTMFAAKEAALKQGYTSTEKVKQDGSIELRIMVQ